MFQSARRGRWLRKHSRPVTFHHLVSHPPVDGRVCRLVQFVGIFLHFVVIDDPIHFAVRSSHEAIQRHMDQKDDLSHVHCSCCSPSGIHCQYLQDTTAKGHCLEQNGQLSR